MNPSYLNDTRFLAQMDMENYKETFVRITILDFHTERKKANIEGKVLNGSCNFSGTSNMRRTASCSLLVDPEGIQIGNYKNLQQYFNITEIENLISLNKKVRFEIGLTNTLKDIYPEYSHYDVIWYPLGIYVIQNASVVKNQSGINISLTLNDKCALLNGNMGGTFPADTIFSELESYNITGTQRKIEKILLKDIIKFLVIDYGGELPENVIIEDIPDTIVKVMRWNGDNPIYLVTRPNIMLSSVKPSGSNKNYEEYAKGKNIGYVLEPFVYPGTLECNAGETVATILNKIKDTLGNFEWFYDVNGKFHFQKKKNYLTNSKVTDLLSLSEKDYLSVMNLKTGAYTFNETNRHLITSISNAPQYANIKNDFIIWGTKKNASGIEIPIRYHLSFNKKPTVDTANKWEALVYTDYRGLTAIVPVKTDINCSKEAPPSAGNISAKDKTFFYIYNTEVYRYDEEQKAFRTDKNYKHCYLTLTDGDWRAQLYYESLWQADNTFSNNPYAAELQAEWPKIWNPIKEKQGTHQDGLDIYQGGYYENINQSDYEYWIDFLEGSQGGNLSISQFNINNIGKRTKVLKENTINCLFPTDIPSYIYIEADGNISQERASIDKMPAYQAVQVSSDIYKNLSIGGSQNSAFERIKELLCSYTTYNESINLSLVPIYHLEPNTVISLFDTSIGVQGNYIINSISLPLGANGTSTINATRCIEKTI